MFEEKVRLSLNDIIDLAINEDKPNYVVKAMTEYDSVDNLYMQLKRNNKNLIEFLFNRPNKNFIVTDIEEAKLIKIGHHLNQNIFPYAEYSYLSVKDPFTEAYIEFLTDFPEALVVTNSLFINDGIYSVPPNIPKYLQIEAKTNYNKHQIIVKELEKIIKEKSFLKDTLTKIVSGDVEDSSYLIEKVYRSNRNIFKTLTDIIPFSNWYLIFDKALLEYDFILLSKLLKQGISSDNLSALKIDFKNSLSEINFVKSLIILKMYASSQALKVPIKFEEIIGSNIRNLDFDEYVDKMLYPDFEIESKKVKNKDKNVKLKTIKEDRESKNNKTEFKQALIAIGSPDKVETFEKIKTLGSGSFGVVYSARNKKTGKTLVVKMISKLKTSLEQVKNEVNILNKLKANCETYILCYDNFFEDNTNYYIVTEFLEDYISLYDLINQRINIPKKMPIIVNLLDGLQLIHKQKIAHRDIKPENIMVSTKSANIKYIDFGLSCYNEQCNTTGVVGTYDYMPPEIANNQNKRELKFNLDTLQILDKYALGKTIYELITDNSYVDFYTYIENNDNIDQSLNFDQMLALDILFQYFTKSNFSFPSKTQIFSEFLYYNELNTALKNIGEFKELLLTNIYNVTILRKLLLYTLHNNMLDASKEIVKEIDVDSFIRKYNIRDSNILNILRRIKQS